MIEQRVAYDLPPSLIKLTERFAGWRVAKDTQPADASYWQHGARNPDARWLPHTWNKVLVLGIGRPAMQAFEIQLREDLGADTLSPAVAYHYHGENHVKALPDGLGVLADGEIWAAGMREGFRPLIATLGQWHNPTRTFYIPPGIITVQDGASIEHFNAYYQPLGVPLP